MATRTGRFGPFEGIMKAISPKNIAGFLKSLKGVTSFVFTVPDHASTEEVTGVLDSTTDNEKSIRVVCDSFNENYQYEDFYSLSAVFRRVYE